MTKQLSLDCYHHYKAKSYKAALSLCEQSANQGDVYAMWRTATIYYYGLSDEGKDYKASFSWYLRAAESGLVRAQRFVGESYLYADGVEKDFDLAYLWLNKAAEQQDPKAEFALAMMFLEGKGREKDISSAIRLLKRAAEQQHLMAINNLAWLYATSSNYAYRNTEKALYWAEQLPVETIDADKTSETDHYLYLDTLAAAYAASENFEKAIAIQQKTIQSLPDTLQQSDRDGYHQRLESYQQNTPWIDESI